ncbi:MAG: 30S ribosomal protein S16 [Chlamydiae bacterium RIFCSPHIGHO2_12_FULL_27_8]|nr:MAG: 30S ribosomal protein S16 [Chlamydiae bacterium RIFCSPHIGHO2_12_FULL_27_8]OGN66752.1 MAG: 30S ribosomal protein S16 [Chlamydiae bacterium RIFCSPLOWO2_01_FULL_28_7]
MALMIRLRQVGRTNNQSYRLVVIDKKAPRDGKYIEMIGWYNPFAEGEKNLFIEKDKVESWLEKGAELSLKAESLVKRAEPDLLKRLYEKKLSKKNDKKK